MSSSRVFLKPKVRDTEIKSLNSTIVCETKEYEDDDNDNEEMDNLKIVVKPKGHNSQYNYDETSSDIGNIDDHYTDNSYYNSYNTNANITLRNTMKNLQSSDSSTFQIELQDLYNKQDKIIANYNPNLSKSMIIEKSKLSDTHIHFEAVYNKSNYSTANFNPNFQYRDSKNTSRSFNDSFQFNDIHGDEKIPTYYNNSNIRYPNNSEKNQNQNQNQNYSPRSVFEETKYFDYHDMGFNTQRTNESFSVENPRCIKRKPINVHIDESCTYEADIESKIERKRDKNSESYPNIRIITSKSNSPTRLSRVTATSHNSSISCSTFGSNEDEKNEQIDDFSGPNSMSKTMNDPNKLKKFKDDDACPYIGDIEEFYNDERKNKKEYQNNPLHTPVLTARSTVYFNDESSVIEGDIENINSMVTHIRNTDNDDVYSECPSDKDSFFEYEKDDQMSLSGDIEDFHAISEREIRNFQAEKVRIVDLDLLISIFYLNY